MQLIQPSREGSVAHIFNSIEDAVQIVGLEQDGLENANGNGGDL
jgi:hypothetical protein